MSNPDLDEIFPCPGCGSQHLDQEVTQYERVEVDEDGNYEHIEPLDEVELQAVYCTDCEERIEPDAVDEHEAAGHGVTGRLRPDRLLSDDPWTGPEAGSTDGAAGDETAGDDTAGGADREPADRRDDGGEH